MILRKICTWTSRRRNSRRWSQFHTAFQQWHWLVLVLAISFGSSSQYVFTDRTDVPILNVVSFRYRSYWWSTVWAHRWTYIGYMAIRSRTLVGYPRSQIFMKRLAYICSGNVAATAIINPVGEYVVYVLLCVSWIRIVYSGRRMYVLPCSSILIWNMQFWLCRASPYGIKHSP